MAAIMAGPLQMCLFAQEISRQIEHHANSVWYPMDPYGSSVGSKGRLLGDFFSLQPLPVLFG